MDLSIRDIITLMLAVFSFISLYLVKPTKEAASEAKRKAENTEKELNNYKLHVAEKYVTNAQLDKHFERIEKSIDELKQMFERKN